MAQGEVTKEETEHMRECLKSLTSGIPKTKLINYIGELNDLYLFLDSVDKMLDSKKEN